jgi:acid phosphatase
MSAIKMSVACAALRLALLGLVAFAAASVAAEDSHPRFGHVFIIVGENTGLGYLLGNTADAPYIKALIDQYGLATESYANTHPSIGNYMMLVTGQVLTNDDRDTPASFPVTADNIVRRLAHAGRSWKAYAEGLPEAGYLGGNRKLYAVRHVPIAYLSDLKDSPEQRANLVPFTQLADDLRAHNLPEFAFITPDACNDAHNCRIDVMDKWLQQNVPPLLANEDFKKDGLLIITFDEAWGSDAMHGGGRIPTILISPALSKRGYRSDAFYQHGSTLRLMLEGLGLEPSLGAARNAPPMWEFFAVRH